MGGELSANFTAQGFRSVGKRPMTTIPPYLESVRQEGREYTFKAGRSTICVNICPHPFRNVSSA